MTTRTGLGRRRGERLSETAAMRVAANYDLDSIDPVLGEGGSLSDV